MNVLDENMPFRGQVAPATISAELVDEALDLLGFGDDAEHVTSFTFESVEAEDAYDAETPNLVGSLTVSTYKRGVQFTATVPVVDTDE